MVDKYSLDVSDNTKYIFTDNNQNISMELDKISGGIFYYDETNNYRTLTIKNGKMNNPPDRDFVLGGVYLSDDKNIAEINNSINKLKKLTLRRVENTKNELKFRHLCKKGVDFLDCLNDKELLCFLKWLDKSGVYIHYFYVNYLFWSVVDIIDSIDTDDDTDRCLVITCNRELKNALYQVVRSEYEQFFQLMVKLHYPNLQNSTDVGEFYKELKIIAETFIEKKYGDMDKISGDNPIFYTKVKPLRCLILLLDHASQQKKAYFLQDNETGHLLDNLAPIYINEISQYKNAKHIFDSEGIIEKEMSRIILTQDGEAYNNYQFSDSKTTPLIQISDCVVGLLGKYYDFLNSCSENEIDSFWDNLNNDQEQSMTLFVSLIKKSLRKNQTFIGGIRSLYEYEKSKRLLFSSKESNELGPEE